MKTLLALEMRRALSNRLFVLALSIGLIIAIAAAVEAVVHFETWYPQGLSVIDKSFRSQFALSAWTLWMPMASMRSIPNLFFFIAPLLIGLAYAWSCRDDLRSGYAVSLLTRANRVRCYAAKACATFVSGGLVVAFPLVVNLLILLCCIPCYPPEAADAVSTGLYVRVFWSELYFSHPAWYAVARTLLDFVLAGLWATAVLAFSLLVRNRVAIVALPYVALLAFKYISESLCVIAGSRWGGFTILDQLRARGDQFYYTGWSVMADVLVLAVVTLAIPLLMRKRDVL